MTIRHLVPLVLVAAFATGAAAREPIPPESVESAEAQQRTVVEMRNVGTALFNWLEDQVNDDTLELAANPDTDTACTDWDEDGIACDVAHLDKLPEISHQELTRILVPAYIAVIPEKDGWGNPYEFRLERKYLLNKNVMAIRSPGKDGVYSGNRYESGSFSPLDSTQDLVWKDAFFVRWPERKDVKAPK